MRFPIYRRPPEANLLCQGDILDPSCLRHNLVGHQDYFVDRPYFYRYMILTQTCDLVRGRNGAEFIFLAVVRRLRDAFGIRPVTDWWSSGKHDDLMRDLLKHNHNRRGFFYLPKNARQGIEEDSVVDLRVMFSLHRVHYSSLLQARRGALTEVYAAKLGHLTGHLFNRVATPSWGELNPGQNVNDYINTIKDEAKAREERALKKILLSAGGRCTLKGCSECATTYRQIYSVERAVCEQHAMRWDEGSLPEDLIKGKTRVTP